MSTVFVVKTICLVVSLIVSAGVLSYFFGCKVTAEKTFGVSTWRLNPNSVYRIVSKIENLDNQRGLATLILKEKYSNGRERIRTVLLEISLGALLPSFGDEHYLFNKIPSRFSIGTEFVGKEPILRLTHISRKQYREYGSHL